MCYLSRQTLMTAKMWTVAGAVNVPMVSLDTAVAVLRDGGRAAKTNHVKVRMSADYLVFKHAK